MPRQYGTTGVLQLATAPAAGPAGNTYFNTTDERLYISDGTLWAAIEPNKDGYRTISFTGRGSNATAFMIQDNGALLSELPKGTVIHAIVLSADYYFVVASTSMASTISANPLLGVTWTGTTTNLFTKTAHGLNNGDAILFTATPPPGGNLVPFYVVNAAANTFQVSQTLGGAVQTWNAGSGTTDVIAGTHVTVLPNPDYVITRGWVMANLWYSYDATPPGYPISFIQAASAAPSVAVAGNMYFNTTTGRGCISDGTSWFNIAYDTEVEVSGWISAAYSWMAARNNEIMVNDFSAGWGGFPKGTRINASHGGNPFFGTVIDSSPGSAGISANPLPAVSCDATGLFTKTSHGLVANDIVWISGGTQPTGSQMFLPYYVINTNLTTSTFRLSGTPLGTQLAITGASASLEIRTGTHLTLAPNADYGLTRAVTLLQTRYSYTMTPTLWPGWFNYTTTQAINPLTFTLGYSVIPTSLGYNFRVDGNKCIYNIRDGANGTSNAGTLSISLPVQAATRTNALWHGTFAGVDNGAAYNIPGGFQVASGATVVQCFRDVGNVGPWTATLGKRIIRGQVIYEI